MPSKIKNNLTGMTFGGYTVLSLAYRAKHTHWLCVCSCGKKAEVSETSLFRNKQGCQECYFFSKKERFKGEIRTKDNPVYSLWAGIKNRIFNVKEPGFKHYGGRGLSMEDEWVEDFHCFEKYINEVLGPKPSKTHSIDRIDNDLGYIKNNIRWATRLQQSGNKREMVNTRKIVHLGVQLTIKEFSSVIGKTAEAVNLIYSRKGIRTSEEYFTHFKIPKLNNYD